MPDRIFLLTAEIDEIWKRLQQTGDVNPKFNKKELLKTQIKMYDELLANRDDVCRIDTTKLTIPQVYEKIKMDLSENLGINNIK